MDATKQCQNCCRDFSVFIRPYSCELCNARHLCSNCAIKFVLSYEPNPSFLRMCNQCCDKMSRGNQLGASQKLSKPSSGGLWSFASSLISRPSHRKPPIAKQSNPKSQTYSYPLQDQAPLIPEAFIISTPNRKAKHHKLIEQHRRLRKDGSADPDPAGNADGDADDEHDEHDDEVYHRDDDYVHYLTMHPLNRVNVTTPQSILCASMNQAALNISINHSATQHLTGELTRSSMCDCYSHLLQQQQTSLFAAAAASPQSAAAVTSTSDDNVADANGVRGQAAAIESGNAMCLSVSMPMNHRKFKSLRIELLFDANSFPSLSRETVAANVVLYDRSLQLWSGTQIVQIQQHNEYQIIANLSVDCYQTVRQKCVRIVGSMAWKIADNAQPSAEEPTTTVVYPYRNRNVSTMLAALTQQRFDIIDSYDCVVQQRNGVQKNLFKPVGENENRKASGNNEIDNLSAREVDPLKSEELDKEDAESDGYNAMNELDGGSKVPTKRKVAKKENALCTKTSAHAKQPVSNVEQMEKNMLQHEIARIDSMLFGLERISSMMRSKGATNTVSTFDEATTSMNSSNMFETNEIRDVKLQIANHLNDNIEHTEHANMGRALAQDENNFFQIANCDTLSPTVKAMPICLLCQRCSKTMLLCETL